MSWGAEQKAGGGMEAGLYFRRLIAVFLDRSNASSLASPASRRHDEKLMSSCSGWMPQMVTSCGISRAAATRASAPWPSLLFSTLWQRGTGASTGAEQEAIVGLAGGEGT